MAFSASGPANPPGLPNGPMNIQNHQILMWIITLHATLDLQSKSEDNRTKNGIFSLRAHQPVWAYPMDQ